MINKPGVVITGASGFIGGALVPKLVQQSWPVRVLNRSELPHGRDAAAAPSCTGLSSPNGRPLLNAGDCLVHLAARVHVVSERAQNPLAEFRRVNVNSTIALAQHAAQAGVKRFVFVSSVKVHGEHSVLGRPFTETDSPNPQDPYAVSKLEAEQGLREIAEQTGMELVIIRPPLVYGPGVKANFAALMRAISRGLPLPFGAIQNKRSLVGLDNLIDFIVSCLNHPAASGETFLISDGEDVSTAELVDKMGVALGRPARTLSVPQPWLEWMARAAGKPDIAQRLCGSLQIDITKARSLLKWQPPMTLAQGLQKTAQFHLTARPPHDQ